MLGRTDANFSLSGLKTAVRNEASRLTPPEPQDISDLCASFQAAVLESTADRLSVGLRLFHEQFGPPRALVAAGGVAANQAIRGALQDVAAKAQTTLIIPPPALCTDNGAMIAWAGAERLAIGLTDTMDTPPRARWLLDENATAPAGSPIRARGFRSDGKRCATFRVSTLTRFRACGMRSLLWDRSANPHGERAAPLAWRLEP